MTPWTVARQASLAMGLPRQEYWSGLPFLPPEDLTDPGIEPMSPALEGGLITTMKAHESLVFNSNEAMKILSLLFCFMFLDCFSIFHLNTW